MTAITDPFVLPEDVALLAVEELPPEVRDTLTYEEGDVAVQRLRTRTPSKVVSRETADLLEEFREASTIAAAVVRYSLSQELDPQEVLVDSLPMLQQFILARWLVPAGEETALPITARWQRGDQVGAYQILSSLQVLEDTEIYQARDPAGAVVALKVARTTDNDRVATLLANEAQILRRLDGYVNPILVAEAEEQGLPCLVLSWCAGAPVTVVATEYRQQNQPVALLKLCVQVVRAFAHLHQQGVVHGDIHPQNILVDGQGTIHLLDFGLAQPINVTANRPDKTPRGGVAFFFEPEYAQAQLTGSRPPSASPAGEQYALASLIYHLLTGVHYLNFTPEQEKMLHQIVSETPLSFAAHGLAPWPAVEQVLARALAKQPALRYANLDEFAAVLASAIHSSGEKKFSTKTGPGRKTATFLENVVARLHWDGSLFQNGLDITPTASVNYGAAGIAYFLYRLAGTRGDPRVLALADAWLARATAEAVTDRERAFYNPDIDITADTVGQISPYHSESGIHLVDLLITGARGDRAGQVQALHNYLASVGDPPEEPGDTIDLTLGWAGVLLGATLIYEALDRRTLAYENGLVALGEKIMRHLWGTLDIYPPIADGKTACPYLGVAHGWAGFLYATLRWVAAIGQPIPGPAGERLDQLLALHEPFGRGARWPWQLDNGGTMPGWCNGTTGFVYLWSLAAQITGDHRYGSAAEWSAWNAWEDPAQMPTLCCGLAGRAYALLHWYRHTGDDIWRQRATILTDRAARAIQESLDEEHRPFINSLYKGEIGVAALISDLADPAGAALPLFEEEGFPPKE